ncbi:MAG: hypothetical protein SF182_30345, partial [Deltaproteobacteria bacterium]|nr:hypothetical protein [Deltaproteobacteria bacterium]
AAARLSGPGGSPSLRRDPPPLARALLDALRQRADAVQLGALVTGALGHGLFARTGSVRLSQLSGSGILVVDGPLELDGAIDFEGLIVVDGDLRVADGAAVTVDGGLLQGPAANLLELRGQGIVRYDQDAITRLGAAWPDLLPLAARVTGWRELAEVTP